MRKPLLATLACVALLSLTGCSDNDDSAMPAPKQDPARFQYTLTSAVDQYVAEIEAGKTDGNPAGEPYCLNIDNGTYFVAGGDPEYVGEEDARPLIMGMGDGTCAVDDYDSYDSAVVFASPITASDIMFSPKDAPPTTSWAQGGDLMGSKTPWDFIGPTVRAAINYQAEKAVEGISEPAPKLDPARFQYTLTAATDQYATRILSGKAAMGDKGWPLCLNVADNDTFLIVLQGNPTETDIENSSILMGLGDGSCAEKGDPSDYKKAMVTAAPITMEMLKAATDGPPVTSWSKGADLMGDATPWDFVSALLRATIEYQGQQAAGGIQSPN